MSRAVPTAPTPAGDILRSIYRQDNELVLQSMLDRSTERSGQESRFEDVTWDLTPVAFREDLWRGIYRVDFSIVEDPRQQLTAKEYLWTRLNDRPIAGFHRTRLAPTSARAMLGSLVHFMRFVAARTGRFNMQDVDQPLLDAYLAHTRSVADRSPAAIGQLLSLPIDLNRHASRLTLGAFACRPWSGRSPYRIAGVVYQAADYGNRTARIPEAVIAPLLRRAIQYVEVFSNDIFAARRELDALQDLHAQEGWPRLPLRARLASYMGERAVCGRGIPMASRFATGLPRRIDSATGAREPALNFALIALQLGCEVQTICNYNDGYRDLILKAFERLGPEMGGLDTMPSIDPETQRPWRDRFDHLTLAHEEKMLQAACYIICAYLSGMRNSEVQAMRTGCHLVTRSADGLIERHHIVSRAYKGHRGRGVRAQWVTIATVGRAVAVLEQLTARQRSRRRSDSLWQTLSDQSGGRTHLGGQQARHLLNGFRAHLDAIFGDAEAPAIPYVDGHPWRLTTRQFRRSVAWYIANRPFGSVAGKIQYQHASIAMFEGYAGGPPSGLRREIEQERLLGQLDDIVEHYEDFKRGLKPTGPASARLLREFARLRDELNDLPGRIVDRQRIRTMLQFLGRTLHVGFLNDCFFEPAAAMCLERSGASNRSAPRLSHCSPDRCPNSCITRRHLPAWERSVAETQMLLKNSRLSSLQRKILIDEGARIQALVAPLKEPSI